MARESITGITPEEVKAKRYEFDVEEDHNPSFDEAYCLCEIPHQPDDYDGPPRFCYSAATGKVGGVTRCKHHGRHADTSNLDKLAAMTHGLTALRKHIRQTFDEKDAALYDWVVNKYPAAYDINNEESPADAYDIHRLAVEIVRADAYPIRSVDRVIVTIRGLDPGPESELTDRIYDSMAAEIEEPVLVEVQYIVAEERGERSTEEVIPEPLTGR